MKQNKLLHVKNIKIALLLFFSFLLSISQNIQAQVPHPDLGLRADWLRGTYGLNWKPAQTENGKSEAGDLKIDAFLEQIKHLKTVDYIQVHLNESGGTSAVHLSPNDLIESFWEGDVQGSNPINLAVPRVSSGKTPLLDAMKAIKAAGLKVQIYANSAHLLYAASTPQVSVRFKNWCDTNPEAQAFINSKAYHDYPDFPNRKYMFCYAEFILKDYAIRYGDLVDAWLWDAGRTMWIEGGDFNYDSADGVSSNDIEEQRVYQAFADACHAGNPNAAISFNNSPGDNDLVHNPFTPATYFDDYMFGHPFSGGKNVGNVAQNFWSLEWIEARDGYIFTNDQDSPQTWDDNIVGHWDPPMGTGQWNTGSTGGVIDEEFADYYGTAIIGNGAVSFGVALVGRYNFNQTNLIAREWVMHQLELLDAHLSVNQYPGAPNWSNQETVLPDAFIGQPYNHILIEGEDFWDPEGDDITTLLALANSPSWLTITETSQGEWTLSGTPTETIATYYDFDLEVSDASLSRERNVTLSVMDANAPNWAGKNTILPPAYLGQSYMHILEDGVDFSDPNGDTITALSIVSGDNSPSWLTITETEPGVWQLSGTPTETVLTNYNFRFEIEDASLGTQRSVDLTVYGNVAPNWIEEDITLPDAFLGQPYEHILIEGVDFWDLNGDEIMSILATSGTTSAPSWLTITETESGVWTLGGIPTETITTNYDFNLEAQDTLLGTEKSINLTVYGNIAPNWIEEDALSLSASIGEVYSYTLREGVDFSDINGDVITSLSIVSGDSSPSWLTITETETGVWTLSGAPNEVVSTNYDFRLEINDGFLGTTRLVNLSVLNPTILDLEIRATENTNYGVSATATMFSEVVTAFDGKATFKLSIDVIPVNGKAISSAATGGGATNQAWGMRGDGRETNKESLFYGEIMDWADIGNIQVVDFNANGGDLSLSDLSDITMKSIRIVNGQSANKDAVAITVNGETTDLGNVNSPILIEDGVTSLSIGNGFSPSQTTNKWSVEGVTLSINFSQVLSVEDNLNNKMEELRLFPNPASNIISFNLTPKLIQIYDIRGKLLKSHSSGSKKVDVSNLKTGVYIVKFLTKNGDVFFKKLMKKNDF